jgi:hypothetical protein
MWIRDSLPMRLPTVKVFLYGYDSTITNSTSFQNIEDLASTFINMLQAYDLICPSSKPLVFLAHSLGGVVLKQALI